MEREMFIEQFRWVHLVAMGVFVASIVLRFRGVRSRSFWALAVLALCYPLGKLMQVFVWGPAIIRWYIADIGFVPFATFIPFFLMGISVRGFYGALRWLWRSLVLAIVLEVLQGMANPYTEGMKFIARGDLLDVGMYFLGAGLANELLKRFREDYVWMFEEQNKVVKKTTASGRKTRNKRRRR
ncbi:MAG TPA: hypothetical protein VJB93_03400 [Patescibacteria group bacterium]|nr:hypothetical protein [Patescibacteria group bacterium]